MGLDRSHVVIWKEQRKIVAFAKAYKVWSLCIWSVLGFFSSANSRLSVRWQILNRESLVVVCVWGSKLYNLSHSSHLMLAAWDVEEKKRKKEREQQVLFFRGRSRAALWQHDLRGKRAELHVPPLPRFAVPHPLARSLAKLRHLINKQIERLPFGEEKDRWWGKKGLASYPSYWKDWLSTTTTTTKRWPNS